MRKLTLPFSSPLFFPPLPFHPTFPPSPHPLPAPSLQAHQIYRGEQFLPRGPAFQKNNRRFRPLKFNISLFTPATLNQHNKTPNQPPTRQLPDQLTTNLQTTYYNNHPRYSHPHLQNRTPMGILLRAIQAMCL